MSSVASKNEMCRMEEAGQQLEERERRGEQLSLRGRTSEAKKDRR